MRLIFVAQAAGAFGVRGELRLTAHTADPLSLIAYSPLRDEDGREALTLITGRVHKGALVARAREVATREEAEALRGLKLYVDRDLLPPTDEEEYYLADLIGLEARAPDGTIIGRVKSVADFGAGDLLEITPDGGGPSWWTPFTHAGVPEVRLADGWLTVTPPEDG